MSHRVSNTPGLAFCGATGGRMYGVWGEERYPVTCAACLAFGERFGLWPSKPERHVHSSVLAAAISAQPPGPLPAPVRAGRVAPATPQRVTILDAEGTPIEVEGQHA